MTSTDPSALDSGEDLEGVSPPDSVVNVNIRDLTTHLEISFQEPISIGNTAHLFQILRDVMSSFFSGRFLMIKYASRVHCSYFPVIQDPRTLEVFLDPLMMLRDPAHLFRSPQSGPVVLNLYRFDSSPNYYRKKTGASVKAKVV